MIIRLIIAISFLLNFLIGFTQKVNYLDIRDSIYVGGCGQKDSTEVYNSINRLENLDTNLIRRNIHVYYQDLAICYWLASRGNNEPLLIQSVKANLKAIHHKPKSPKTLWDLAFGYVFLNDCIRGKHYMELYKKQTPKKYWNKEQEDILMAKCN